MSQDTFTCWTATYIDQPVHNEITMCFAADDSTSTVHCSYWYDGNAHIDSVKVNFDWAQAFHTYEVIWAPSFISYFADGKLLVNVTGIAQKTIPYLAGQALVILRPLDSASTSDTTLFNIQTMSYSSEY